MPRWPLATPSSDLATPFGVATHSLGTTDLECHAALISRIKILDHIHKSNPFLLCIQWGLAIEWLIEILPMYVKVGPKRVFYLL